MFNSCFAFCWTYKLNKLPHFLMCLTVEMIVLYATVSKLDEHAVWELLHLFFPLPKCFLIPKTEAGFTVE